MLRNFPADRPPVRIFHQRKGSPGGGGGGLSLRLAGKKEADIIPTLRKRYQGVARRVHQFNNDDVYQFFINAYTLNIEPHTSYMSPRTSENFDISMRLSLQGIGAVLRNENE